VKIASQPLRFAPLPNLCALRALCGESPHPFRITNLQIPLPARPQSSIFIFITFIQLKIPSHATPLFSHLYKAPGCHSPHIEVKFSLGLLWCACQLLYFQKLAASSALLPPFCALPPFVFNRLRPLLPKYPGGGVRTGTATFGCPPTISPRFSIAIKVTQMTSQSECFPKPSASSVRLQLRTSIPACPKWSIIPAPVSPARLRGRSV
jgi:hypothetical protein